jgi:Putative DNA-binding domain
MDSKLSELQTLFYHLITAPNGFEEAARREAMLQNGRLDAVIAGNKRLSAGERLTIYANAYFYRLYDVFKEDFHCVYTILGDVNFHNLITGYLIEYPPSEPSVFQAGAHLPHYLLSISNLAGISLSQWPFLADLARLERACLEVFHGADAEALEERSIRDLRPESWPSLGVRLQPSAQILELEWATDKLMTAIKEGRPAEAPARVSATILVWRQNCQVRYRTLARGERTALKWAASGRDFASICAALADDLESSWEVVDLASIISQMLTVWLRDGLLTAD